MEREVLEAMLTFGNGQSAENHATNDIGNTESVIRYDVYLTTAQ